MSSWDGGCFCGGLRYRFTGVWAAGYCHCTICRRTSGAPVMGWVNTPRATFEVRGAPRFIRTSPGFQRAFCGDCGTHVWSEDIDPTGWDQVSVHYGTIDRAAEIPLTVHIWFDARLPGFDVTDGSPRHPGDIPRS